MRFHLLYLLPPFLLRMTTVTTTICLQPRQSGYSCPRTAPGEYFHFDATERRCLSFEYYGCGGNINRFINRRQCEDACRPFIECGAGSPLLKRGGAYRRCSTTYPCPFGYECVISKSGSKFSPTSSFCCPKASRVCRSEIDVGNRCGGTTPTVRYYYDHLSNQCRHFTYLGCGGNDNKFMAKGSCIQFCSHTVNCLVGDPWPDRYSTNRLHTCRKDDHCPGNYTCIKRANGRFMCCPSREAICGQHLDKGSNCVDAQRGQQVGDRNTMPGDKWWFDAQTGACQQFAYSGCGGNGNRFASRDQCQEFCLGSCPKRSAPKINPFTGAPQLCDLTKRDSCPVGFRCHRTSSISTVCCEAGPSCPQAESQEFIDDQKRILRCLPEDVTSCPQSFRCILSTNGEHICCTPPLSCPMGMREWRDDSNSSPRRCTIGVPGGCPSDYSCVRDRSGGAEICCKPTMFCVLPVPDADGRPKQCHPAGQRSDKLACPAGSMCLRWQNSTDFNCCYNVKYYRCENGEKPIFPNIHCACDDGMACTSFPNGKQGCCSPLNKEHLFRERDDAMSKISKCGIAAIINGTVIPCTFGKISDECPAKTQCSEAINGKFYCCLNGWG